jgi:hypothetical protein
MFVNGSSVYTPRSTVTATDGHAVASLPVSAGARWLYFMVNGCAAAATRADASHVTLRSLAS